METSNWADLPEGILHTILEKLFPFVGYTRLGCVCKAWLSVASANYEQLRLKHRIHDQVPLLMMHEKGQNRSGYSIISGNKVFAFELPLYLADDDICGSSHGCWLAFSDFPDGKIVTLHNPILDKYIFFPPFVCRFGVLKVIVTAPCASSPIGEHNYLVVANLEDSFAYIRSGDDEWTYIYGNFKSICDLVFYKGRLRVLDIGAKIRSYDILGVGGDSKGSSRSEPKAEFKLSVPDFYVEQYRNELCCFAESSNGGLFVLSQSTTLDDSRPGFNLSESYRIFETKVSSTFQSLPFPYWTEIRSLGEQVLLGDNQNLCVKASDFPECKPNCIYYSNDIRNDVYNCCTKFKNAIIDIEDGSFREYKFKTPVDGKFRAVWISLLLPKFSSTLSIIQADASPTSLSRATYMPSTENEPRPVKKPRTCF